jgi:hypothetical protein
MPPPTSLEQLTARLRLPDPRSAVAALAHETVPGQTVPGDRLVALVWAVPDLAAAEALTPLPFRRATRDRILGASTAAVRYGPVQLLLEAPDGERSLIGAYVARHGQGLAAFYLERPRYLAPSSASGRPPRPLRSPFGRRGWLLPHEWPWGPFVVALEPAR